ncbi:MAG: hypothetical protein MUF38_04825 [Anaerolineae bacterium]|nr:hypothetical protein [Anaerolineae bacterium]
MDGCTHRTLDAAEVPLRQLMRLLQRVWVGLCLCALMMGAAPVRAADDGSVMDVLIAYTPLGRAQLGGTDAAVHAQVSSTISEINTRFANAGIETRLRWVGARFTFYLEQINVDFHADLNNLMGTTDGYMDELHPARDAYAADLVLLITGSQFAIYTGDAPVWTGADASRGFAVVEGRYFSPTTVMTEVGRLLGATGTDPTLEVATVNASLAVVANYRVAPTTPPVNRLSNGGFEIDADGDGRPDFWTPIEPRANTGQRCGVPTQSGGCALRLVGRSVGTTAFNQRADLTGLAAGDLITLSGYARTVNAQAGATLRVIVHYTGQPKQRLVLRAPVGTTGYGLLTDSLILTGTPRRIVVSAHFNSPGAAGVIWFDDVSLVGSRQPTP